VVILALASLATDFIAQLLAAISLGLMFVWYIPAQWFLAMLGLSILTTLYGHYIEKRPLI
jgi:ABC-type transport system involved in multi-copper enzyme maturation permease subunit